MIDIPSIGYEDNDLIKEIREKYGSRQRDVTEVGEAPAGVQDEFRVSGVESRQDVRENGRGDTDLERRRGGSGEDKQPTKRRYRRKGSTDTYTNESDGSAKYSGESANGAFQPATSNSEVRPSGIDAIPNAREKRAREEGLDLKGQKGVFGWLKTGKEKESSRSKPFTAKEAEEAKEPLKAALADYFFYADELIYATHKAHRHVSIWSSIDDEELDIIVDVWISKARRSGKSAKNVSFIINKHMELKIGLILAPRFYATFRAYVDGGGISIK